MRIPQFWTRASRVVRFGPGHDPTTLEALGWSFDSEAEARVVAEQVLERIVGVLVDGKESKGRYLYGDRPVREPILDTVTDGGGQTLALVTRNAYGAVVLNTQDVAFVDVDLPRASGIGALWARLRGRRSRPEDVVLERVRAAHAAHPEWVLRIYRTAAGLRIVALHARLSPKGPEAAALFEALGADRLYRRLCVQHDSFRARLTPKPWRVGLPRLPAVFPWRDAAVEQVVLGWVRKYEEACRAYGVCEVVETLGAPAPLDAVMQQVLRLHDDYVLRDGKPLA